MNLNDMSHQDRKARPIARGVLDYFPDAIAEVAYVSFVGNEQHHPGTPVHWDRAKSTDEADAAMRHFMRRGKFDKDGIRHTAKFAWRALALLQKELEAEEAMVGQAVTAMKKVIMDNPHLVDPNLASRVIEEDRTDKLNRIFNEEENERTKA